MFWRKANHYCNRRESWVKNKRETEALHYDVDAVSDVIDTTGAGDVFAGGYLAAMLRGDDVRQCVKKAHLAASYVIRSIGADLTEEKWFERVCCITPKKNKPKSKQQI